MPRPAQYAALDLETSLPAGGVNERCRTPRLYRLLDAQFRNSKAVLYVLCGDVEFYELAFFDPDLGGQDRIAFHHHFNLGGRGGRMAAPQHQKCKRYDNRVQYLNHH